MYCGESLVSFLRKHDIIKIGPKQKGNAWHIVQSTMKKIPGSPRLCNFNVRVPEHGSLGTRLQVQECNSWFYCALYLELSDCCKALSFEFYRRQLPMVAIQVFLYPNIGQCVLPPVYGHCVWHM